MGTKVRILSEVPVDGVVYQPNQVVDLPVAVAKSLEKGGVVDSNDEAVAYCLESLGATLIVHKVAVAQQQPAATVPPPATDAQPPAAVEPSQPSLQDIAQPGQ